MPMKQTAHVTIDPAQLQRVRRIAAENDWYGHPPHQEQGSHNTLLRQLADGNALLVNLPDPTQRAMIGRFIKSQLQLGRDTPTTAALTALLAALELAEELAKEAAKENTAEKETE